MKTKLIIAVLLIVPFFGFGQFQEKGDIPEVQIVAPEFTGIKNYNQFQNGNGLSLINDYLKSHTVYPEEAGRCLLQGTVVVKFIVTSKGEVTDFKVINSVCPLIDKEIVRVLSTSSGMWKPGLKNGELADMEQEAAMMFVVNPTYLNSPVEYFTKQAKRYCKRANKTLFVKHNPKKALKYYNETVRYAPYDQSCLLVRGLCRYELGDREGARSDWERVNAIGNYDTDEFLQKLTCLPGYNEMMLVLNI